MSGIRTLADLQARCYVDDVTGCWIWRGATNCGSPVMWLPPVQKVSTIGVVLSVLTTGKPEPRVRWLAKCGERLCCNPQHRKRTTHAAFLASFGTRRTPEQAKRCALVATRHSDALVEAIRADVGTGVEIAARHGVSRQYVSRIRRGEIRAPASPFAQLLRLAA